jgi:ribosomal protein L6P/L9E
MLFKESFYADNQTKFLFLKRKIIIIGKLGTRSLKITDSGFSFFFCDNYFILYNKSFSKLKTIGSILRRTIHEITYGVSQEMELRGLGFKIFIEGNILRFHLGFSHEVYYKLPDNVSALLLDNKNTKFLLKANNKELLSNVVEDLLRLKPLDPYKGKGISKLNELIGLKPGKKEFR